MIYNISNEFQSTMGLKQLPKSLTNTLSCCYIPLNDGKHVTMFTKRLKKIDELVGKKTMHNRFEFQKVQAFILDEKSCKYKGTSR